MNKSIIFSIILVLNFNWVGDLKAIDDIDYFESYLVRTEPHAIKTVANHIDETGKNAIQISDEMVASRSYDDWLVDYFVTYEKNGYVLEKISLDFRFSSHLEVVDGQVSSNNVPGCHNRDNFLKEVYDPITAPGKRVVIINETPKGLNGWTEIEYRTYQVDAQGNILYPQLNGGNAGFKIVYNPSIISQNNVKEAGYNSLKNAIDNPSTNIGYIQNQPNSFFGLSNSIEYRGYLESNKIKTWLLK